MEHLATIDITSAQTVQFAIPKGGIIRGVYSDQAVTIAYDDNGTVGTLLRNVTEWEPNNGFAPAPIAYVRITTTAAAHVSIRYEVA